MDTLPLESPLIFTQAQYSEFARLSGDDNPIHVDEEFSKRTRFGRTVAHGMFIFATFSAALARAIGGPVALSRQELVFSKPTFTGDPLTLQIDRGAGESFAERLVDGSGDVTSSGEASLGKRRSATGPRRTASEAEEFKGLRLGMSAARTRRFERTDVDDFLALVDDPNPLFRDPDAEVPPALVGGMVSWLLGVDLPGPGTNWLKQIYTFHQPIPISSEIRTTVTVARLRPEKELVNLSTVCKVDDVVVASGEALVLAHDVASR